MVPAIDVLALAWMVMARVLDRAWKITTPAYVPVAGADRLNVPPPLKARPPPTM
jgi:hypothetical protein